MESCILICLHLLVYIVPLHPNTVPIIYIAHYKVEEMKDTIDPILLDGIYKVG